MKVIGHGLRGYSADELRSELERPDAFQLKRRCSECDMRALWLADDYLSGIDVTRKAAPWLLAKKGAAVPEVMLSTVLRPGDDEDGKAHHKQMAFVRAYGNGCPSDTYPMQLLKATETMFVDELGKVVHHQLVGELRTLVEEKHSYLELAKKRGHDDDLVRKTLTTKVEKIARVREKLSQLVAQQECELMGVEHLSPDDQRAADTRLEIARDVKTLVRREKCPPASSLTQRWVLGRVKYLKANPQEVKGNVSRRRVYLRDVWATDQEEAMEKYHLPDFKAYRRCYEAARKSALRKGY